MNIRFLLLLHYLQNKKKKQPLRVLDFGGGLGNSFIPCIESLGNPEQLEFHIVEANEVCMRGCNTNYDNLFFYQELPNDCSFDIVHIAATLHYVRDWKLLLEKLIAYNPQIIMLNALNAGNIKTFVSYQNYYGEKIPVWFWNINEILEHMSSLYFKLIYKSKLEFTFLGKTQPLPMDNFPSKYRLERKCNLMFVRA